MAVVAWTNLALTGGGGAALPVVLNGTLSTSNTYTFPAGNNVFVHARKTGAGACTATAVTPGSVRGVGIADTTYTIPATTGDVMMGPFPPDLFADANGLVTISFSDIAGLSAAPFQLPS